MCKCYLLSLVTHHTQGEYVGARDNLEVALAVISRPIPTSYYGIVTGLLWSLFSHVLFQVA